MLCRYFFLVSLILPVPHYLSFCFPLFLAYSLNPLSSSLSLFSLYLCVSLFRSIWKLVFVAIPYMWISYIITNYTVLFVFRSSALDLYYHRLSFICDFSACILCFSLNDCVSNFSLCNMWVLPKELRNWGSKQWI